MSKNSDGKHAMLFVFTVQYPYSSASIALATVPGTRQLRSHFLKKKMWKNAIFRIYRHLPVPYFYIIPYARSSFAYVYGSIIPSYKIVRAVHV